MLILTDFLDPEHLISSLSLNNFYEGDQSLKSSSGWCGTDLLFIDCFEAFDNLAHLVSGTIHTCARFFIIWSVIARLLFHDLVVLSTGDHFVIPFYFRHTLNMLQCLLLSRTDITSHTLISLWTRANNIQSSLLCKHLNISCYLPRTK